MNTIKRFRALCLDTHMKLALYKYAIIIIIIIIIIRGICSDMPFITLICEIIAHN